MLKNFVVETVNAPGTAASVNLLGAVTGRVTFKASGHANGATVFYFMEDGTNYECGYGILTHGSPDIFNRQTVKANSAGTTSRINFAGTTSIYNEIPAEHAIWRDVNGNLDIEGRLVSALWWGGTSTGTGGAYVVSLPKAVTSHAGGLEFKFRAHATSTVGATCNVGLGAKAINRPTSYGLQPVQAGEIVAGQLVQLIYDPTTDTFVLANPPPGGLSVPIGTWLIGGWSALPAGCLWPDGRNVSRTTYAALFAAYSTTFGIGDGSTTFGLPDLRGRTVIGKDDMGGTAANRVTSGVSGIAGATLGAVGGSQLLHAHNHGINDSGHAHYWPGLASAVVTTAAASGNIPSGMGGASQIPYTNFSLSTEGTGISIQSSGSGGSQNMPPGIVGNIVVYAGA